MARWVSLSEASRILKLPETTLRRMAVEGKVMAEREARGPGDTRTVWRIRIDAPDEPPPDPPPSTTPEAPSATEPATTPPDVTMRLLDSLEERDTRITALHERIAALERENGKLEAALQAAEQRLTEAREQAARSWWRRILGR